MPHVHDASPASHDRHDRLVVAALAAGDLTGTELDQARALIASCPECAALHGDLIAIARATATLPPPILSAGRDFRLSPAQAESLALRGWRRFLPAGRTSSPFTRPLGVALATLGIAGLLIGTVPLGFPGSVPATNTGTSAAGDAAQPESGQRPALGPVYNDQGASAAASAVALPAESGAVASGAAAPLPAASAAASSAAGFGVQQPPGASAPRPLGGAQSVTGSVEGAGPIAGASAEPDRNASTAGGASSAPVKATGEQASGGSTGTATGGMWPLVPLS